MKHKQSGGFAAHLVLMLILVASVVGSIGWYVVHRHNSSVNSQANADKWETGVISVKFKDGITKQQALGLIKSYGLNSHYDTSDGTFFRPELQELVNGPQAAAAIPSLQQNPEVTNLDTNNFVPKPHYSQYDGANLTITFKEDASLDIIKQALASAGINDPKPYVYNNERTLTATVPKGKEDYYIKKFETSDIVSSAARVTTHFTLING